MVLHWHTLTGGPKQFQISVTCHNTGWFQRVGTQAAQQELRNQLQKEREKARARRRSSSHQPAKQRRPPRALAAPIDSLQLLASADHHPTVQTTKQQRDQARKLPTKASRDEQKQGKTAVQPLGNDDHNDEEGSNTVDHFIDLGDSHAEDASIDQADDDDNDDDDSIEQLIRQATQEHPLHAFDNSDNSSSSNESEDESPLQSLMRATPRPVITTRRPRAVTEKRPRKRRWIVESSSSEGDAADIRRESVSSPGEVESSDESVSQMFQNHGPKDDVLVADGDEPLILSPKVTTPAQPDGVVDEFIQPEGDARVLPIDIQDQTSALSYDELWPFFDHTAGQLEQQELPKARSAILQLERQWKRKHLTKQQQSELYEDRSVLPECTSFRSLSQ